MKELKEIKLNWNFDQNENRLNFSLNSTFKKVTVILKERTSNLTCFYWKDIDITENITYFITPTNKAKLLTTDFSGFFFYLYGDRTKIFDFELKIVDTPAKKYFYSDDSSDLNISDSFYVQYLDFYNNSFLNSIVKEGDVVFDIGASCGTFADFCLKRKASKVICLEPSPSFYILDRTFDSRVERYNMALGIQEGYKQFYFTEKTTLNSFKINDQKKYDTDNMIGTARPVTVECISLKNLITKTKCEKIDLLKLDIEGYEYDIFNNLKIEDLKNIDQILIEFHHNENHKTQHIVDKLVEAGFNLEYLNLNFEHWYTLCDLKGIIYGRKKESVYTPFNFDSFFSKYKKMIEKSGQPRINFYKHIIPKLASLNRPVYILETGAMWEPIERNTGAFTIIMADLIKNHTGGKLYTVDISKSHLDACKSHTKEFADVIEYVESDSIKYLKELNDSIASSFDLLYLDSYDLYIPAPHDSANHHLLELTAVYSRLNPNCCIAIDDNYLPGTYIVWQTYDETGNVIKEEIINTNERIIGKGEYCNSFLLERGWKRFESFDIHGHNNIFYYENKNLLLDKIQYIDKTEDGKGIQYRIINEENNYDISTQIIDSFTGFNFLNENMTLNKECVYFTTHAYKLPNQIFKIFERKSGNLLFEKITNTELELDRSIFPEENKNLIELVPEEMKSSCALGFSYFELYAHNTYNHGDCKVERDDIVFDLGANCGLFSRYCFLNGAKKVYSFEPTSYLKKCFEKLNAGFDYMLISKAVYSKPVKLVLHKDSLQSHVEECDDDLNSFVNLNQFIKSNKVEKIDYLKIDIEGSEYDLFRTIDKNYLKNNVKKIALEYHNNKNNRLSEILDVLNECEFSVKFEYENGENLELGMLYAIKNK